MLGWIAHAVCMCVCVSGVPALWQTGDLSRVYSVLATVSWDQTEHLAAIERINERQDGRMFIFKNPNVDRSKLLLGSIMGSFYTCSPLQRRLNCLVMKYVLLWISIGVLILFFTTQYFKMTPLLQLQETSATFYIFNQMKYTSGSVTSVYRSFQLCFVYLDCLISFSGRA